MMQEEYICDKISALSAIFIRTNAVTSIKPNPNNGGNAPAVVAATVLPVAPTANRITCRDVLQTFAAETKAKRINLFPRASVGGIYIYTFDGSEF